MIQASLHNPHPQLHRFVVQFPWPLRDNSFLGMSLTFLPSFAFFFYETERLADTPPSFHIANCDLRIYSSTPMRPPSNHLIMSETGT